MRAFLIALALYALGSTAAAQSPPQQILILGGFAPTCQQSANFLNRVAITAGSLPQTLRSKQAYDALICGLVNAGIFAKLDGLYAWASSDVTTAFLNLKSSSFTLTQSGTSTFTAYSGLSAGTAGFQNTGFNPTTGGQNYVQNSATIFTWAPNSAVDVGCLWSFTVTAAYLNWFPRSTGDNYFSRLNGATEANSTNTDGSGFWSASRTGSAGYVVYRNGASFLTPTATSGAVPNDTIIFGANVSLQFYGGTRSFAGFGSGLTAAENLTLYTIVQQYLRSVGAI